MQKNKRIFPGQKSEIQRKKREWKKRKQIVDALDRVEAIGSWEQPRGLPALPVLLTLLSAIGASVGGILTSVEMFGIYAPAMVIIYSGLGLLALSLIPFLGGYRKARINNQRISCLQRMSRFLDRAMDVVEAGGVDTLAMAAKTKVALRMPDDAPDPVCPSGKEWAFGNLKMIDGWLIIDKAAKSWVRCPHCQPKSYKRIKKIQRNDVSF